MDRSASSGPAKGTPGITSEKNLPQFDVRDFGAKGDGKTDDSPAINAAIAKASETGGVVNFPSATYLLRRRPGAGQVATILLRPGVSLDGQGSTLLLDDNCGFIGAIPSLELRAVVDTDAKIGDTSVHVTTTENFVAGDPIGIRLGDNEWDKAETKELLFTTVKRVVDGNRLEFADALPRPIDVKNTVVKNRGIYRFRAGDNPRYVGGFVQNFRLQRTERGNPESGIDLRCAKNVRVENISATDPGAGVVLLAYCSDVLVRKIFCDRSVPIGGHTAKGRIINVWNSDHCAIEDVEGRTFGGPFAFIESYCRDIRCINWRVVNDWSQHFTTPRQAHWLFLIVQNSEATFTDLQLSGNFDGEVVTDTGGTPGRIIIDGLKLSGTGRLKALPFQQVTGRAVDLGHRRFAGTKTSVFATELEPGSKGVQSEVIPGELWRRVEVEATGLTQPEKVTVNGYTVTVTPAAPKAEVSNLTNIGDAYPANPPTDRRLKVTAPALSSKIGLKVTVEYFLSVAATP